MSLPTRPDGCRGTAIAIRVGAAAPATAKNGTRLQKILGIAGQILQMAEQMRQPQP